MRSRRRFTSTALIGLALAATTVACSGTDSSSAAPEQCTPTTGEPIVVGNIVGVSGTLSYPELAASVKAGIEGLNCRGGVGGRPVELVFCNEGADPNLAATCARQMVERKVVATVSDQSPLAEAAIGRILSDAGIPQVGAASTSLVWTAQSNVFLTYYSDTSVLYAAAVRACVESGHRKIAVPYLAVPANDFVLAVMRTAAKALGAQIVSQPKVEVTATDVTPVAQTTKGAGADCVAPSLPAALSTGLIKAMQTIGFQPTVAMSGQLLQNRDYETLGPLADGMIVTSSYPVPTDISKYPVLARFQADMKRTPQDLDLAGTPNLKTAPINAWFAVQALAAALKKVTGPITASSLMATLKQLKEVDLGLPMKWSPNKTVIPDRPRIWSATVFFHKVQDGQLTSWQGPTDVMPLMTSPSSR